MVDEQIDNEEENENGILGTLPTKLVGKRVEIITGRRSWKGIVRAYDPKYAILTIETAQGRYTIRLRNIMSIGILK